MMMEDCSLQEQGQGCSRNMLEQAKRLLKDTEEIYTLSKSYFLLL